eukprot:gnl/TRDRNA2_/TRDRNA2_159478_c4_seq1.p2 gnl/TRDRNA2_/TRDRNA2_159478_c4~~gnl/TRDRNA2_/TRDRNA2_159478_c4_seq1.p2  ORF type:complete len:135 (-),score=12.94 gnl/TRDRNA2_/TRDRNA2_159478_c4_seq1:319-723(-)
MSYIEHDGHGGAVAVYPSTGERQILPAVVPASPDRSSSARQAGLKAEPSAKPDFLSRPLASEAHVADHADRTGVLVNSRKRELRSNDAFRHLGSGFVMVVVVIFVTQRLVRLLRIIYKRFCGSSLVDNRALHTH